jgi:hypothetical protein
VAATRMLPRWGSASPTATEPDWRRPWPKRRRRRAPHGSASLPRGTRAGPRRFIGRASGPPKAGLRPTQTPDRHDVGHDDLRGPEEGPANAARSPVRVVPASPGAARPGAHSRHGRLPPSAVHTAAATCPVSAPARPGAIVQSVGRSVTHRQLAAVPPSRPRHVATTGAFDQEVVHGDRRRTAATAANGPPVAG